MPLFNLTLQGGKRNRFNVAGTCFSVVTAPAGIQEVQLYRDTRLVEDIQGPIYDGFEWEASYRQSFDAVDVTPVDDQTVVVFMGEGFARQMFLNAESTVNNPINVNVAALGPGVTLGGAFDIQTFGTTGNTYTDGYSGSSIEYDIPDGKNMLGIICIGAGGGGGGGRVGAANNSYGGAGGGAGASFIGVFPVYLLPANRKLFLTVGKGGSGGVQGLLNAGNGGYSRVSVVPETHINVWNSNLALCMGGLSGANGLAGATPGGLGGTNNTINFPAGLYHGLYSYQSTGDAGQSSSQWAQTTNKIVPPGYLTGGGASGGGLNGSANDPGNHGGMVVTYNGYLYPGLQVPYGIGPPGGANTRGGNGSDGVTVPGYFSYTGGAGGGAQSCGNPPGAAGGGSGGKGNIGSGGGGGGAGLTGSDPHLGIGGDGGDGLIIMIAW